MAQPMGSAQKFPAFCLLLFGSDAQYTHADVCHRWEFIVNELKKLNIDVLSISSDSDPKYNSSMRKLSSLGCKSEWFFGVDWFSCGGETIDFPFCVQDMVHIATKLRNFFLKTIKNPNKLPFGKKFFIRMAHLNFLLEEFGRDEHCLTQTILNPIDKQNYDSVLRMTDKRVIDMLRANLDSSHGTIKFLEIMRNIIDSYLDVNLKPIERVEKIFYAVFMIRIWREFIVSRKQLTLKDNFLTLNCYTCIELNAHSLILCLLHLKKTNRPDLFLPHLFGSQQCESYFRQIRSFTTTYSTVANCSVKEILERVSKIQLQNEISYNNSSNYKFPRLGTQTNNGLQSSDLPTMQEIHDTIQKCKINATQDAVKLGLIEQKRVLKFDYSCKINPYVEKATAKKLSPNLLKSKVDLQPERIMQLRNISLTNHADKFENQNVEENSPYVEVYRNSIKRVIVKKTSFCWMLRNEYSKISSDRLERVKSSVRVKRRRKVGLYHAIKRYKPKFSAKQLKKK